MKFTDRLTQPQAGFLAANFTVLDSVEKPHPLGSGFDATIWQINAGSELAGPNNENAGKVYVSMRGTQGAEDIADDVALAATGVPISQIVDMCNWWLRISTASGQQAMQIRYQKPGEIDLETGALTQSYGYKLAARVAGADLVLASSNVAGVNGHSLGGYLATAFTRLFGGALFFSDAHRAQIIGT
ncbi:MAG: hypothetical protein EAZ11_10750 [Curvibacter sp.]|nr:MAG: hypothetical protein EAZ11_10750 [Curvibacter sp.]